MEKMNSWLRWTFIIVFTLIMCGCKKAPINDDIQGFWILKVFTTLEDGKLHKCERLYYSIGRFVTEISERQGPNEYGQFVGLTEFRNNETELVLKGFRSKGGGAGDTGVSATIEQLLPFGINNQEETVFEVVKCNGKVMTLQSDYARLELEKF